MMWNPNCVSTGSLISPTASFIVASLKAATI